MKRKQEDLIRYLYEHEEKLTSETLSKCWPAFIASPMSRKII